MLLLMILAALVMAAVLLLNRTHSRTGRGHPPAVDQPADADLRRLREDLRSAADRVIRSADRVLSFPARTPAERARSELMEPPNSDRAA